MRKLKFHTFRGVNRDWYFQLRAGNGRVIAVGEGYRRKGDMLNAIKLVKGCADVEIIEEKES